MGSPERAVLKREAGATAKAMQAMTDSGDATVFTISGAEVWSRDDGKEPDIRPNGIKTGRNLLSGTEVNDQVAVKAFTAYVGGAAVSVDADNVTITRPATALAKVCAICVDAAGALTVEAGTDGSGTTFSETYAEDGGPPTIPDAKIMIGQVRVTSDTAAPIDADEIFQADGVHTERFDMPMWKDPNTIGDGLDAEVPAKENAHLEFESALPQIHTSGSKPVYAQVYVPIAAEVSRSAAVVAPQNTYSSNEQKYYGGSVNSVDVALSGGSFEVLMSNGVSDAIKRDAGKRKTFWWYPDRNKTEYSLFQGVVGINVTNPIGNQIKGAITVTADRKAADFDS